MDCIVHGVTKSQTQLSDFHSEPQYTILDSSFVLPGEKKIVVLWDKKVANP